MFIHFLFHLFIRPALRRIKKINGWENIPQNGPAILVANHINHLDGWLLNILLLKNNKRRALFISKSKYYTYWAKGTTIPLTDLGPKGSLERALHLLKQGEIIAIFPEGERNPTKELLKGKTGAARLALWSKCPVIPIGFIGPSPKFFLLACFDALFRPRKVSINIGKPVDLSLYYNKDITYDLLTDCTRTIMFEIGRLCEKEYVY